MNKLRQLKEKISNSRFFRGLPAPIRWVLGVFSHNIGFKLLSLLMAILMWNYVITTDTSITRAKTLYGITGYITGQATLTNARYALLSDPGEALSNLTVTVEAAQADYARVSPDNVQVVLDLSSVRSAGTQEGPLRASSSYGRVTAITPESLTLTFEALDSRTIAVNPVIDAENDDYWYNITRTNPAMLTVSGAASVVRNIASARVSVDASGLESSTTIALPYTLLDTSGEEVPQAMLNLATSSISITMDVYPCRDIAVSKEIDNVVTGQPASGYFVQAVSLQPETISVAAERELLDSLTELVIEPVSVEGASQSFSARASLSRLPDFKNVSSEQVYVNVTIAEETVSGAIDNVNALFTGLGENLTASYEPFLIYATGSKSAFDQLANDGVTIIIDLTDRAAGNYLITPTFEDGRYGSLVIQSEAVSVTVKEAGSGD